jgi:hypothetical protein
MVSSWSLYIGVFLCASGIGLVVGIIFIAYWGIKTLEEAKAGNSYTENNYTVNIDNYYSDNGRTVSRDYITKDTLEENR